jgi:hypothetical protein
VAYEVVENFAAGLDNRKSPLTAPGGTLTRLTNAAVNPGGEIEKRRAFVKLGTNLLAGTFGLAATSSTLYVFGRNEVPTVPASPVPGVGLVGLQVPGLGAEATQTDYDVFDGRIYLVCYNPSGLTDVDKNPHYYAQAGTLFTHPTEGAGKGYYVRTYQSKIYSVTGKYLYFSAVNDPMLWDTGTGHGYINLSLQDADSERLTSLEVYYDKLGIFSTEAIQLWAVDPDPLANAYVQLLRGTGTNAPRSTSQYGSGDVLYLDQSGVRSMKAKDSSNSAAVSDIGSPIDALIQEIHRDRGQTYFNKAIALLEPLVGRFWMVFPDIIYVLSYFPGPKITAWSKYVPGFTIDHAVACGGHLFFRAGDDLYVYGGTDGGAYDNCGVEIRLPYLNGKKPGNNKIFEAIDLSITGSWQVRVSYDFNNPDAEETIGNFAASTWNGGRAELTGNASHISLRFHNSDANPAVLSNVAVHYQVVDDEQ